LICVLAVPSFMSVVDFFNFLSKYLDDISKIRIVRDDSPNRYMGILKFKKQEDANYFYQEYNGRPFNSLDPEECKLIFVSHMTIDTPFNVQFQDIGIPSPKDILPQKNTFEIPSCPICLEILDAESSGIVTTMCNHSFHCQCLNKWGKPTCPCCRYDHEKSESVCFDCGEKKNLWVIDQSKLISKRFV
jgi:BRCA1-associated protein